MSECNFSWSYNIKIFLAQQIATKIDLRCSEKPGPELIEFL